MIEFQNVSKYYGTHKVLDGVNLKIQQGDVLVLCGPSGSGKTTMAKATNGLEAIQEGRILIDDKDQKEYKPQELATKAGMVFQQFDLFPNYTALANVMLAQVKVLGRTPAEAQKVALELLEKVGMTSHVAKYPKQLSGGQQQRVAIARALAMNPEILILDEPTASLDPENVKSSLNIIQNLAQTGTTMMIVTHEMAFAKNVSNRIAFFNNGKILEDTTTEKFFTCPDTQEARDFLSNMLI